MEPIAQGAPVACAPWISSVATRALSEITWYETPAGIDARTRLRGDIIATANAIPVKWHALRDSRGRFVAGEDRHG